MMPLLLYKALVDNCWMCVDICWYVLICLMTVGLKFSYSIVDSVALLLLTIFGAFDSYHDMFRYIWDLLLQLILHVFISIQNLGAFGGWPYNGSQKWLLCAVRNSQNFIERRRSIGADTVFNISSWIENFFFNIY